MFVHPSPSNHHQLFIFKESNRTKDKNFKITEPTVVFTIKELTSVENLYHVELNKISKSSPVILVHELFTLLLPQRESMERKWMDEIILEIVIYNAKETTFFHNFIRCQVMIGVTLFFL